MRIPCLFNQCTIRQRLILLNTITGVLVFFMVSIYTYQLILLENKLVTIEHIDDLFYNILEVRRYEKNIILRFNDDSVTKAKQLLQKTNDDLNKLSPKLNDISEKKQYLQLKENLNKYTTIFDRWCASENCMAKAPQQQENSHLIRQQGQKLVDGAAELVNINRKNISNRFKKILFWLTFIPAVIFTSGAILFFSQVRSILSRLSTLKQGTRKLAAGEFKPIPALKTPDEVSDLVLQFNQMVETLEQKQEQLIQSKKMASIGTFSSGIAHEINNPLNNISLSTDTLLEEIDSMDKVEIREILDDIMEQTERASKIVRNLLDFSRTQSSEVQSLLYIDFILHKTTDLIANELRIHKIALKKDIADMLPQIYGDLHKLQQVFLNLIINAEQAIGDYGTITVRARETDNGYIRTDISDTGPGISQEYLDQIFDPFFTTKEAGKGTGLGLAIVYGIIKKHGGYIEVASKLGEGTTFSVYLPLHRENTDKEQVSA